MNRKWVALGIGGAAAGLIALPAAAASAAPNGHSHADRPSSAATATLTNVGVSQTGPVNGAQTNYPVSLHWTNSGDVSSTDLYRYDNTLATYSYIGTAQSSVNQWFDVLAMNGGSTASGDYYTYYLYTYDSSGNLNIEQTVEFQPVAFDDASGSITYSHGPWYRKNLNGATNNHYTYSSASGARASTYLCYYNVGLVGTTGPSGGTANILQNGVVVKKVSFHASSTHKRVLLWKTGNSTAQCGSIEVVRTGGQINVDSIQEFSS